jgi:hypothetical protein
VEQEGVDTLTERVLRGSREGWKTGRRILEEVEEDVSWASKDGGGEIEITGGW